jgi:hypothetical protein
MVYFKTALSALVKIGKPWFFCEEIFVTRAIHASPSRSMAATFDILGRRDAVGHALFSLTA